jgi:hypothetical protein
MTDATHVYVVFSGGYTTIADETWQFGIRYLVSQDITAPDTSGTLPLIGVDAESISRTETDWNIVSTWSGAVGTAGHFHPDDWLNDQVAPAAAAFFAASTISNQVRLDSIKASPITATGHVAELRTTLLTWTGSNPVGGQTGDMLPPEVALAVSWQTPRLGKRGRGRIYLPPCVEGSNSSTGQVGSGAQDANRDAAVTLLEDSAITSGIITAQWALPIVTGSPWTQYGEIIEVRVGSVWDAQRRRRRQLAESYSTAPVSY